MNTGKIILITGTDTGIGKTYVGCGLASALTNRGIKVVAIKPVESGVGPEVSQEEDGVLLAQATRQDEPKQAFARLRQAVAPPVAADLEGIELDLEDWIRTIEKSSQEADIVLIEGAGGFLSPLTWKASARMLAMRVQARALLVVGNRLGCVNHTLLTMEALEQSRIPLAGVILNSIGEDDKSIETNFDTIRQVGDVERIVALPNNPNWKESGQHLDKVVEWVLK